MVDSKLILTINAIISGIHGFIFLFAADEIINWLGIEHSTVILQLQLQFLGIMLLAMASLNWMSKGQLVGGIYGRPIVVANLMHSFAGAILLGKFILNGEINILFSVLFVIYLAFTMLFGKLMFSSPTD